MVEKSILYWLASQDTATIELNENLVAIILLVPKRLQTIHGHHLLSLQGMSHKTSVLCKFYLQKKKKSFTVSDVYKYGRYMVLVRGKEWFTIIHSE